MRLMVKVTWKRLGALILIGLVGAFLIGWTGFVSISASSGHWSVTRWFLGWTMENAVRTQALLVSKPEDLNLKDPALVRRSAGHYATGCAGCHGAPGVPQSLVVQQMVPAPPRLEDKVGEWSDEELYWIVKNGIKFSGMPSWPAQMRHDEVWAQVAFLRELPEMTAAEYASIAFGEGMLSAQAGAGADSAAEPVQSFEEALADCSRCHGEDGLGARDPADAFPIIAGQPEPYLYQTLQAFAHGQRDSGFMQPPAHRYSPEMLAELASHYAAQPAPSAATAAEPRQPIADLPQENSQDGAGILEGDGELAYGSVPLAAAKGPPSTRERLLDLGRHIAVEGIGAQKLPACQSCHGRAAQAKNRLYPYLAGQREWYLSEHLRLWREGERGGTRLEHVMKEIAEGMTDEQIIAVSAWYASRP